MKKDILKQLVDKKLSTRTIAKELGTSQTNIRYWLKKFNLKTFKYRIVCNTKFTTRVCATHALTKFIKYGAGYRCRKCATESVNKKRNNMKLRAIEYKGGYCLLCGYNKCSSALDFHHINPLHKKYLLGKIIGSKSWETVKSELDKCIVVCANCHREIHAKLIDLNVSVVQIHSPE